MTDEQIPEFAPFWRNVAERRLCFPRCEACGRFHWYPLTRCPHCFSADIEWRASSPGAHSIHGRLYGMPSRPHSSTGCRTSSASLNSQTHREFGSFRKFVQHRQTLCGSRCLCEPCSWTALVPTGCILFPQRRTEEDPMKMPIFATPPFSELPRLPVI